MIQITVRYHNLLRQTAGVEQETIALPEGMSLPQALDHVAERHGPALRQVLFAPPDVQCAPSGVRGEKQPWRVSSHLVIFRNGQLVPQDQRDVIMADGDELKLFLMISGG